SAERSLARLCCTGRKPKLWHVRCRIAVLAPPRRAERQALQSHRVLTFRDRYRTDYCCPGGGVRQSTMCPWPFLLLVFRFYPLRFTYANTRRSKHFYLAINLCFKFCQPIRMRRANGIGDSPGNLDTRRKSRGGTNRSGSRASSENSVTSSRYS